MIPKRITIHCSDSPNGRSVSVDEIRKWHLARGWFDIGYHYVIDIDGISRSGRPLTQEGAHVEGANQDNVGICMIGKDRFTEAQFHGLREDIRMLCQSYNIPHWEIYGHYLWPSAIKQGKSCPNMAIQRLIAYIQGEDAAIEPYLLKQP